MSRVGDWHLLGREADPVPATADAVERVASDHDDRARRLREVQVALDRLSALEGWSGRSAEIFAVRAAEHVGALARAAEDHERASGALRRFADDVAHARGRTGAALQTAEGAERQRLAHQPDPLATPEQADVDSARLAAAEDELAAARHRLESTLRDLDDAADRCRRELQPRGDATDGAADVTLLLPGGLAATLSRSVEGLGTVSQALAVATRSLRLLAGTTTDGEGEIRTVALGLAPADARAAVRPGEVRQAGLVSAGDVGWAVAGLLLLGFAVTLLPADRTDVRVRAALTTARGRQLADADRDEPRDEAHDLHFAAGRHPLLEAPGAAGAPGDLHDLGLHLTGLDHAVVEAGRSPASAWRSVAVA